MIALMLSTHTSKQRNLWADKLMDLANLQAIVLVFGQFVSTELNLKWMILGITIYIVLGVVSSIANK